jgi:hypothetical protein
MCEKQWWEWAILYGPGVLWCWAVWLLRGVEHRHRISTAAYLDALERYNTARQRLYDRYGIAAEEEDAP